MKIKHAILIGTISSILLSAGAFAHAGKPVFGAYLGDGEPLHEFNILRKLDLTDAQKQSVKEIMQTLRAQTEYKGNRPIHPLDLDQLDPEQLAALQDQQRQRRENIFKVRYQIHQTLTAEQREKLAQWQQNRTDKRARYEHKASDNGLPRIFEKLDLSPAQIAEITPLHEQIKINRQASKVLHDSFRASEANLLNKASLDLDTWQQYADDFYAAITPFQDANMNYQRQINNVLNEEQKAKLADMREQKKDKMKHKMEGHGGQRM